MASVQELLALITATANALAPALASPLDTPLCAGALSPSLTGSSTPDQLRPPPPGAVPDAALDALATLEAALADLRNLIVPAPLVVAKHGASTLRGQSDVVAMSFHTANAIRIAMHAHVAEILRDQPQGMHVCRRFAAPLTLQAKDIAKKSGIAPGVLTRSLRLLACQSIFREVTTGVFAANKLSSPLDTGLPVDELLKPDTAELWAKSSPIAALLSHTVNDVFPASGHIVDSLRASPGDENPGAGASKIALGDKDFFQAIKSDGNGWRVSRFSSAMRASSMCVYALSL